MEILHTKNPNPKIFEMGNIQPSSRGLFLRIIRLCLHEGRVTLVLGLTLLIAVPRGKKTKDLALALVTPYPSCKQFTQVNIRETEKKTRLFFI
jgi:hypothetical protein